MKQLPSDIRPRTVILLDPLAVQGKFARGNKPTNILARMIFRCFSFTTNQWTLPKNEYQMSVRIDKVYKTIKS